MKIDKYVVLLEDRKEAERLEDESFNDTSELRDLLAMDGVEYEAIIPMSGFMELWNDTDGDDHSFAVAFKNYFINHVNIIS